VGTDEDIWGSTDWPAGWDVHHVEATGSTNTDLIAAVTAGTAADRTVLAADHQTAGRGRLDRRWDAPPGANLLVSIVVAPIPTVPVEATHRVGLAAVAAARRFLGADAAGAVGLKWPNDVLFGDRKLAGILAQRVPDRDAVVVGLGLNVGWAPDGAAALGSLARDTNGDLEVHPARLLRALLEELDALPADIADRYTESLVTIGRWVRVELPGDTGLHGRAIAVDGSGRLVVDDPSGVRHHLDVGDVVHLRTLADGHDGVNQV
jgi:BirA family transcriptional regulator, biotin operon repressor / biotin---[acetyl-CoA-carboxylase] ligase